VVRLPLSKFLSEPVPLLLLNGNPSLLHSPPTSSGLVSPPPSAASLEQATASLSLDDKPKSATETDPEFAAALRRQRDRELEEAQMLCSIENKEACLMCSG
jgi:ribonucleoside-diphosphate reductase subunit M1